MACTRATRRCYRRSPSTEGSRPTKRFASAGPQGHMLHTRRSWCAAPVGVSTLRGRESHADAASDSASAWHPSDLVLRTDSRSPSTLRCTRSQICRLGLVRAGRVARGISGSSALPPRAPMRESQAMQGRPWRAARSWVAPLSFCSWTLTCWSQRRRSFPGERRSKRDGRSLIRVFRHEAKSTLPHLRGRGSQSQIVYTVCRMCAGANTVCANL